MSGGALETSFWTCRNLQSLPSRPTADKMQVGRHPCRPLRAIADLIFFHRPVAQVSPCAAKSGDGFGASSISALTCSPGL